MSVVLALVLGELARRPVHPELGGPSQEQEVLEQKRGRIGLLIYPGCTCTLAFSVPASYFNLAVLLEFSEQAAESHF